MSGSRCLLASLEHFESMFQKDVQRSAAFVKSLYRAISILSNSGVNDLILSPMRMQILQLGKAMNTNVDDLDGLALMGGLTGIRAGKAASWLQCL